MIPKKIHLCWFSGEAFPVEIQVCLDSWRRLLPDYEVRTWTYADAAAIGLPCIDEALACRKWAFAADVVRFYAVWKEGGVYMDSDIFLYRRFDEFIPARGFASFNECVEAPEQGTFGLQAAFFIGEAGNRFCEAMVDYYRDRSFVRSDGSFDETISPQIMASVAETFGYVREEREQHLGDELHIYPTRFLSPSKRYPRHAEAFGVHRVYGSWRKRKFGRSWEIRIKHLWHVVRYALFKR